MLSTTPITDQHQLRLTAYVRPDCLTDPIDPRLQTLDTLAETDLIDELSINVWPPKIPLTATPFTDVIDRFNRFTAWADQTGVSIQPPFNVRTVTSEFAEETRTVLRVPTLCLAISLDDELYSVLPHSRGETQYTVTEAIAALETQELPTDVTRTDTVSVHP